MRIDEQGRRLWQRIAPPQRTAFFSCLVVGYLVHIYAFTNLIPNSDGLSRVYDLQQMTISGRWFLHYASALNNFTQMPAVIGLLSLIFLGLSAALVADLLHLRSRVLAGLSGAVMAAFPCMGYTFLYMFTASAYCLAIFLAVLSVWLAKRSRLGWLLGVIALALAMGTYQAYVTVAIGLSVLVVFRETLDRDATLQRTLRLGLRLVAYLAAGAVVYYAVLQIFLEVKDLELLSYLGMDAVASGYPIRQIPQLIVTTYREVVEFFFVAGSDNSFATIWMVILDVIALLLGAVCFLKRLIGTGLWRQAWRPLGGVAMAALLPLGINFCQIISPYSTPTPLMKYAYVCAVLAVLLLADLADGLSIFAVRRAPADIDCEPAAVGAKPAAAAARRSWMAPCIAIWAAAFLLFSLNTNNLMYTASAQAHQATESYITRLLTRIESCSEYEEGMEIVIIGAIPTDQIVSQIESYSQVEHYSVPLDTVATLNKHIYYYLSDWLNVPVEEPSEETMIEVAASEAFQEMSLYPADGSIQVIDGRLVVKLRESYTPKSDYEIAYENRR